jgi:uncharacterized surface protein with fasciclin (FAS1) repeats
MRPRLIIGIATSALALGTIAPASASASDEQPATLADVLLADSASDNPNGFDRKWWDYDIVTQAVLLFPDLVDAASDPSAELTVFLPTDQAFRTLVKEITGTWVHSEEDVFAAVAGLGNDTVRNVLLYHIVPAKISYRQALQSDAAIVPTLLPDASITVDVVGRWWKFVQLGDRDIDDRDPVVLIPNVGGEAANGYAHGIDRVLRPVDLP